MAAACSIHLPLPTPRHFLIKTNQINPAGWKIKKEKRGHKERRKGLVFFYLSFLCILQEYSVSSISSLLELATAFA